MMLIDRYLPEYQFSERHFLDINADPGRILDIVATRDILAEDPVVKAIGCWSFCSQSSAQSHLTWQHP
jgi:hypothetical protein